jgi:S-DNA-T family DNA segregation ATPase FtsK/SpoIIIE
MLQRRFRIGFSRAGRLVDIMERDGIIGGADGSKPREILVAKDYYESVDARLQ